MKKNSFLTFLCSLVPGCGQMYQGYMKRGFSLLLWFFGIIGISVLVRVYAINLLLPVVWAYSFFDTFNIRALSPEQRVAFIDDFIPNAVWLRQHKLDGLARGGRGGKIVGWVCIALGALIIYQNFFQNTYYYVSQAFPFLAIWFDSLPALAVAAAVIILGIWMLRGKRRPPENKDDIQPFGGEGHE